VMPAAIAAVRMSSSAKMAGPCPPLVRGQWAREELEYGEADAKTVRGTVFLLNGHFVVKRIVRPRPLGRFALQIACRVIHDMHLLRGFRSSRVALHCPAGDLHHAKSVLSSRRKSAERGARLRADVPVRVFWHMCPLPAMQSIACRSTGRQILRSPAALPSVRDPCPGQGRSASFHADRLG
jgi:hypothetical protein